MKQQWLGWVEEEEEKDEIIVGLGMVKAGWVVVVGGVCVRSRVRGGGR